MEHKEARPTLQSLWTRAATLLARFIGAYIDARAFAKRLCAPAVIVADAMGRVRAIEALARRVLLAQALALKIEPCATPTRAPARAPAAKIKLLDEAPLGDDPALWRVRFCVGIAGAMNSNRAPPLAPARAPRHPIFGKRERAPSNGPPTYRPYDPVAARRWRDGRRARKEKAWHDYWMSPVPAPSDDPGYVEILPTNQFIPMASTLPIARRLEALRRVIADPGAYALKLARRLARIAAKIPQLIARFVDRRTRGCADADALLGGFKEVLCLDSS